MILTRVIRELAASRRKQDESGQRRVLNVGGNSKAIPIPAYYDGWDHVLLDIDPAGNPDIVCDARELSSLEGSIFDAIYCSHNLEHYYKHDGRKVLAGFLHLLKDDGFADIRVPDIAEVMRRCVVDQLDLEDKLYESPAGPMTPRDVIYGWGAQIERSGVDFFAHKTGFTAKSLTGVLEGAGFAGVYVMERKEACELAALAFKAPPNEWQRETFGL
ncbi:MAG: hypothetical protein U1F41_04815 [Burkholderiales bacterium]